MVTNPLEQDLLFSAAAALGLFDFASGLKTGRASIFVPGGFVRSKHPWQYWSSIIISGGVGTVALCALVVSLWKTFA